MKIFSQNTLLIWKCRYGLQISQDLCYLYNAFWEIPCSEYQSTDVFTSQWQSKPRYFSKMVLQEYKSFRNVHITLLPPKLSKGEFLEQLCNWESSDSYQVPWGFCWPELPFSSPIFFQATAPTVEETQGLPFSSHFLWKSWAQQCTNHNVGVSRKETNDWAVL